MKLSEQRISFLLSCIFLSNGSLFVLDASSKLRQKISQIHSYVVPSSWLKKMYWVLSNVLTVQWQFNSWGVVLCRVHCNVYPVSDRCLGTFHSSCYLRDCQAGTEAFQHQTPCVIRQLYLPDKVKLRERWKR